MKSTALSTSDKKKPAPPFAFSPGSGQIKKPFIIPVFIPHMGCPHRCVFCDQGSITGERETLPSKQAIKNIVTSYLAYRKDKARPVQISFYGGNFLGLDTRHIIRLLTDASACIQNGRTGTLRFSTRPDTITQDTLDAVRPFPVSTIEIGVQSMNDKVLRLSARGHTVKDTDTAVRRLKEERYEIGLQMMVGLPGDTPEICLETAEKIVGLKPDFTRIYPCVVLKSSLLERLMKSGSYIPLTMEQAVDITKRIYLLFKKNHIRVIRMGLQASEDLNSGASIAAGPYHPSFGHHVFSEIFYDAVKKAVISLQTRDTDLQIMVHPKNESKLRGIKNGNIDRLKNEFDGIRPMISTDPILDLDTLRVGKATVRLP